MKYGSSSTTNDVPSPRVRGESVGAHLDAKLADRRMGQEIAPEQGVVLGLDGAALAGALHPLGAAAARAMQGQPMAARLQPALDRARLRGVGVGAGHIGDQQPADRQPFLDIREVVGDRGRNVSFGEEPQ